MSNALFADSPAKGLVCRNCDATYDLIAQHACWQCFGPLEVDYDEAALAKVTREQIEAGPQNIWRYAPLLPVGVHPEDRVSLNPGMTPLIDAKHLANSVAAHAARAGVPSIVFIPHDLEPGKIVQSAIYGGKLVAVQGSYDDVNRLCSELTETDDFETTAFVNVNIRPYYAEGSKTLGYEVAEQLGWRLPEQVVVPMASGELLTKIHKAFEEASEIGLTEPGKVRVFGAQSAGCSPIADAFAEGTDVITPVKPTGIAKSLNIGDPAAGPYAIEACRSTGGGMAKVTDDEIREGVQLLAATTGVFAETAGGVVVATLRKLLESGQLDPEAETVIYNTGEGLKTLDAVSSLVGPTHTVKPSLKAAKEAGLLES